MLGPVIGELLPSAVGVALSPLTIVAVILMLTTPKAATNGPAFAAGWVLGLMVVCVLVLLVAGGADKSDSGASTLVDWVKLVGGVLLIGVAKKQWDQRPATGETPELPKWMSSLQTFTPVRSLAVGAALSSVNPKNLALTLAASGSIAQAGLSAGGDVVAVAVFVVLGSLTIAVPVISFLLLGDRARAPLATAQQWMAENNATIMTVVCVVLAAKLIGGGVAGLSD